jgi:glutamine synthetase
VPESDRVELRATDGSANPYLATAAVLAAGLDGITRGLDPGDPDGGQTPARRPLLPPTLLHAVEALAADRAVCAALDAAAAGTSVSKYYTELKRAEFFVWHGAVSAWEIERYLTAL